MTTSTRLRAPAVLGALVLSAGLLAVQTPAHAADFVDPSVIGSDPIALETGHIDAFNPVAVGDGQLQLALKEDATGSGVLHTPESVTLVVKESALTSIPSGYPGAPEGYLLPLTQNPDLIWPGWDTMPAGAAVGVTDLSVGRADIAISDVQGPGDVYVFSQSGFGALTSLLTHGGYQLPGTIHQDGLAHVHTNWVFTEPGTYTLRAQATVWNGTDPSRTAASQVATYTFVVGDVPAPTPTVAITGAPTHHLHSGTPLTLGVQSADLPDGATYRWEVQRADQSGFHAVDGQTGGRLSLTAEQALDGAQVRVVAVGPDGQDVATSDAVALEVDDHGAAPLQQVSVSDPAGHYHPGDPIALTASVAPASVVDRWAWYLTNPGEAETRVDGADSADLTLTALDEGGSGLGARDGATIRAALLLDDGREYVSSAPVALAVESHHEPEPTPAVAISGAPTGPIDEGASVVLTAVGDHLPEGATFQWQVRAAGAGVFTAVEGQTADTWRLTADKGLDGAQIRVVVLSGGEVAATSDPVTLAVAPTVDPTPTPTPSPDPSPSPSGAPSDSQQPAGQRLARTGADALGALGAAGLLVVAGAAAAMASRRRRH